MHAALFAVGDCFGAEGASDGARWIRQKLDAPREAAPDVYQAEASDTGSEKRGLLEELVASSDTDTKVPMARAAAYLVTFTGTPADEKSPGDKSSDSLLKALAGHRDDTTQKMAKLGMERLRIPPSDASPGKRDRRLTSVGTGTVDKEAEAVTARP
jgi:hypothetical protein